VSPLTNVAAVLAVDPDQAKPGLVAFLVVLGLALALFFLLRSLAKHLGRINVDADQPGPRPEPDPRRDPQRGDDSTG